VPDLDVPLYGPPGAFDPASERVTFGTVPMLVPPPLPFPRAAMLEAVVVHRRIVRQRLHALLHKLVDPEAAADGMPFACLNDFVPVLMEQDDGRVLLWKASRKQASWAARRCHGIVRELMDHPAPEGCHALVIARGVAALHWLDGVDTNGPWDPDRRYSYEGISLKMVGPPIAAEPWEQWHLRRGARMTTHWTLPSGESGQGEVEIPAEPRTLRERVDRTMAHHAEAIARAHARYYERGPTQWKPFLWVRNTPRHGFRVFALPHGSVIPRFRPRLGRIVHRGSKGFAPVYVEVEYGAGVRWIPRPGGEDAQVPRGVEERDAGE
jgi:hypothetical protein